MKSLFFILALSLLPSFSYASAPTIVGHWQFYMKVYQGQEMPEPPTATLHLHFEFTAEGESAIYWWHEGDGDHCSQKGRYTVEGDIIHNEITWVDPKNTMDCAQDADMQLGRKTNTPFIFRGEDLAIRFQLNGDPLDMVFKRINTEGE